MINAKLQSIIDTKSAIGNAIVNKGGTITGETPFFNYAAQIDGIEVGGATKINFTNFSSSNIPAGNYFAGNNLDSLAQEKANAAATTVGEFYLFAGGTITGNVTNSTDAYNSSLTKVSVTNLSVARSDLRAAKIGNFALFGGGTDSTTVDAYNTSLTRSTPTAFGIGRRWLAASSTSNHAIFAGGFVDSNSTYRAQVDAYNSSLTKTNPTDLSLGRRFLGATYVGNFVIFAGGWNPGTGNTSTVDAYNLALTRSIPTTLSGARERIGGATVNNTAIIGPGISSSNTDSYNISLTRTTGLGSYGQIDDYANVSALNGAMFIGGSGPSFVTGAIGRYNNDITLSFVTGLPIGLDSPAAASIGGTILIASGYPIFNNLVTRQNTVYVRNYANAPIFNFTAATIYGRTITYNYALTVNGSNQTGTITNGATIQSNQTFNGYLEFPSEI
jgi:hypothetical protein